MRFHCALSFLLFLTIGALPGFAQSRSSSRANYSIEGFVREASDQQIMENVRVVLKDTSGTPISTTFTQGAGDFQFNGLEGGEYQIEVVMSDYRPSLQTVTIFRSSVRGINIFLERTVKATNPSPGTAISAHQLSVPHKAHDEFDKGMNLLYGKSNYQEAITHFQRATKDYPTYYEAYAEMGASYLSLKEIGPAEESLRKSIELSSGKYSLALFYLAGLLTDTQRQSEAVTVAQKAIDVDDSSWQGPYELARALSGLKRADEAEKNAIQARDMKPDNPPVYLILANIHIQQRKYDALAGDLDSYLKLVPTGPSADQARRIREKLQANKEQIDTQAHANAQPTPEPAPESAPVEAPAPPEPNPDLSGLPSLPPPTSADQ